jgi:hypothetical protein
VTRIALVAMALVLSACSDHASTDNQALHRAIVDGSSGAEVTFTATALNDPVQSGDHERFSVRTATGEVLEVDHNTRLAQWVPFHKGDALVIQGELYIDPGPRYGVHCTHAQTSGGCPNPGWIEYNSNYYE